MAMMRTTTPGSLTGSLSAPSNMSAKVTVGTVNMTGADMSNYYNKEEVDGLLLGKADLEHSHDEYVTEDELAAKGYLTEHQDISGKADITYVDNAINTALNGIESQLDQIIGGDL